MVRPATSLSAYAIGYSLRYFAIIVGILFAMSPAIAQTVDPLTMGWGIDPSVGYESSDIDSVSHADGNLVLHIPVVSIPQKGHLPPFSLLLRYNSDNWTYQEFNASQGCTPTPCPYYSWVYTGGGVMLVRDNYVTASRAITGKWETSTGAYINIYSSYVNDALGGTHVYHPIVGKSYSETVDGTDYQISNPANTLETSILDPNGISYVSGCVSQQCTNPVDLIKDQYGNTISGTYTASGSTWTDSFSHTLLGPPQNNNGSLGTSPGCQTYNYPSASGTSPYTICWSSLNIATSFGVPDSDCSNCREGSATILAVSSVTSPSGEYTFQYDSWGSLHIITLPRGGSITYGWTTSLVPGTHTSRRALQSRTVDDGDGHTATWTYQLATSSPFTFTVTAPPVDGASAGNYAVYDSDTFQDNYYSADGTLLKTVTSDRMQAPYTYTEEVTGIYSGAYPGHHRITTTWPDGTVSQICNLYDAATVDDCNNNASLPQSSPSIQFSDENQSITQPNTTPTYYNFSPFKLATTDEFAFGSGGNAGALARQTTYTYKWQATSNYQVANLWNTVAIRTIKDSGGNTVAQTTTSYDENNGSPQGYYGNPTSVSAWLNTSSQPIKTQYVYTTQGKVQKVIDPKGNPTTTTFQCSSTYPYQVTNALSQVTTYGYDCNTGLITSIQSPNDKAASRTGTSFSYDSANDLLGVTYPDGGGTTYNYNGYANPLVVNTTRKKDASSNIASSVKYDGLGRPVVTTYPNGTTSETSYNAVGLVFSSSNPHTSTASSTDGYTTFAYDALLRKAMQCNPDNGTGTNPCVSGASYQQWTYQPNGVTEKDEGGNQHLILQDALGRVVQVDEPDGSLTSPVMETDYTYDTLNNLIGVSQAGGISGVLGNPYSPRMRSFTYDLLSRLQTSYNPETGMVCYGQWTTTTGGKVTLRTCAGGGYDSNGNLIAVSDARGVTTSSTYDALNRITQKSASDGSFNYSYVYDVASHSNSVGRLSFESNNVNAARNLSYDPMGRLTQSSYCTPQNCTILSSGFYQNAISAGYDLAGNLTSLTYPDGRVVTQAFDAASRLSKVSYASWNGTNIGTDYLTVNAYSPAGMPTALTMGNGTAVAEAYNSRLELSSLAYANGTTSLWNKQLTWTPNGNLFSAANQVTGIRRQYSYDTLNRVILAQDMVGTTTTLASNGLNESYSYDPFGNMTSSGSFSFQQKYNTFNQLSGYTYDLSGNLLNDGLGNSYSYDGQGKITTVNGYSYAYDAEGNRVGKIGSSSVDTFYFDGRPMARLAGGSWTDLIYGTGGLLAEVPGSQSGAPIYRMIDHLGSVVGTLSSSGTLLSSSDYAPFGQLFTGGSSDPYKFTGKERDTESGNDYFGARYYASSMGRFMSPDWSDDPDPVPYADLDDPQSLNLYAYASNNPLRNIDSDGHYHCDPDNWDSVTNTLTTGACHVDWGDFRQYINSQLDLIKQRGSDIANSASQAASTFRNIMNTPGGPGCMGGLATGGAMVGGSAAALPGLVGLAGGPAVLITEPTALAAGGVGGGTAGLALGMTTCPGGAASGGGGEGSEGSNAKSAKKLSTSRADEAAKKGGYTGAEDLKKAFVGEHGSQYDLYVQPNGDVEIFAKGGVGEGIETGINIKN